MTEELDYRLVRRYPEFELREYPAHSIVEYELPGEFTAVANRAFAPLFQYISGANRARQSIAMTAPVLQREAGANRHAVAFVMPAKLAAGAPEPVNPGLRMLTRSAATMAVRRFSGSWTRQRAAAQEAQLRRAIANEGLEPAGEVSFARFDPPWKPGFLRRNEVMIPVAPVETAIGPAAG